MLQETEKKFAFHLPDLYGRIQQAILVGRSVDAIDMTVGSQKLKAAKVTLSC